MTRVMLCVGAVLAPMLTWAATAADAAQPAPDAPRISVGSVMTPQPLTDTVPTTVEVPPPPTY
jgi:opacity protein-like surface antigen